MFKQRFPLWDENNGDDGNTGGSGGSSNTDLDNLMSEIERLKSHNSKLLNEKKQVQSTLKKFEGIDPDNVKKMMNALESSENAQLLAENKFDEIIAKGTEKIRLDAEAKKAEFAEKEQSYQKDIENWKGKFTNSIINTEIRKQAEKANVIPAAIDDVLYRANGMFSLGEDGKIEARDSDGNLKTVGKKPLDPQLFIQQLKESAPHFWPGSQGVGATGGAGNGSYNGSNPFKSGKNFNLTEQSRIMNSDPELAEKMKAAAGVY